MKKKKRIPLLFRGINQNQKCDVLAQVKVFTVLVIVTTITTFFYSSKFWKYSTIHTMSSTEVEFQEEYNNTGEHEGYHINTPGCQIPDVKMVWSNHTSKGSLNCEPRAVFLEILSRSQLRLTVNQVSLKFFLKRSAFDHCCASEVIRQENNDKKISYGKCIAFKKQITLKPESDFLTVKCYAKMRKWLKLVYSDVFNWVGERDNAERDNQTDSWSVLIFGVDTMSRYRMMTTMPETFGYLKKAGFLDFRGFNKIGWNTFPNMMATLSGISVRAAHSQCAGGMDKCSKKIIWEYYRTHDYITAFAEDDLSLPDTFSAYKGFTSPPTDHYGRPLFLTQEYTRHLAYATIVCNGKISSGEQLISYAEEYARTYTHKNSFGFFWMNSFTHAEKNSPNLIDNRMKNMFQSFATNHVYNNTIVIFMSDHGIRFGEDRTKMAGYYVERLPALMMWVPLNFKEKYPESFSNAFRNQYRLASPYDLHMTLQDVLERSTEYKSHDSEACPTCRSLFQPISELRTCSDAGIDQEWCTCHPLIPTEANDTHAIQSVNYGMERVKKIASNTKTSPGWKCAKFKLKSILKIYYYMLQNTKYYVISFVLDPGSRGYEAKILFNGTDFILVGEVSTIVLYDGKSDCVIEKYLRQFCHCVKK